MFNILTQDQQTETFIFFHLQSKRNKYGKERGVDSTVC